MGLKAVISDGRAGASSGSGARWTAPRVRWTRARFALALTSELESQLDRLRNAAGDDPESRRVASSWPSWVGSLRTSLEALEQMKFNQGRADGGAGKCEAAERTPSTPEQAQ